MPVPREPACTARVGLGLEGRVACGRHTQQHRNVGKESTGREGETLPPREWTEEAGRKVEAMPVGRRSATVTEAQENVPRKWQQDQDQVLLPLDVATPSTAVIPGKSISGHQNRTLSKEATEHQVFLPLWRTASAEGKAGKGGNTSSLCNFLEIA